MVEKILIVDHYWVAFEPILIGYSLRTQTLIKLNFDTITNNNNKFDLQISTNRYCIGYCTEELQDYIPCMKRLDDQNYVQCNNCESLSLPELKIKPQCIFEPQCEGELCVDNELLCKEPHAVYIAFFGTAPKIGMTLIHRLEERVVEQGADFYAPLLKLANRKRARELEINLSKLLKLKQLYSSKALLRCYTHQSAFATVNTKYQLICKGLKHQLQLEPLCKNLIKLDRYPLKMKYPLRSVPKLRKAIGRHTGRYLGMKGRFIFYEHYGLNAIVIDDLIGRIVTMQQ